MKILSPAYSLNLKNIILFLNRGLFVFLWNDHIRNVVSTLPNVVKIDVENDNVVSTLSNVVQFNVEKHNVVSTLIWRCATSRRHINLKATLNRRWNVCWDSYCNIGPYRIHAPQSNLLDCKMSPCPTEIIVVFGKHSLPPAIGLFHGVRFFFLSNCEYLAAFRLSGGSILNMRD